MKFLTALFYSLCYALIAFMIGSIISSALMDAYEETGRLITAKDTVDNNTLPWILAVIVFLISMSNHKY